MLGLACDPPIPVFQFALWINKMKLIYVRLNVVNDNVRPIFIVQMLKGYGKLGSRSRSRLPITLPILDRILEPSIEICHTPYDSCLFQAVHMLTCLFRLYAGW